MPGRRRPGAWDLVPSQAGRIVVEAAQLNAIARQFNVAWRSVSRADRAVLEWPGRPLRKEEAIDAVRPALTAAGASDDIDIDLSDLSRRSCRPRRRRSPPSRNSNTTATGTLQRRPDPHR